MTTSPTPNTARGVLRAVFAVGVAAGLGMAAWGMIPAPAAPVPVTTFDVRPAAVATPAPSTAAAAGARAPVVLEPTRLRIRSLGIDAPVQAERVTADGELVVPGDPSVLASWRRQGPDHEPTGTPATDAPPTDAVTNGVEGVESGGGVDGALVIAGHVDMQGDLGALHPLAGVTPGAEVLVSGVDGEVERWGVDGLEVRAKEDLPDFTGGARRLAIVTCAGPVVRTAHGRGYRDNLIAWATPIS